MSRIALVTGSNTGIGYSIAKGLALNSFKVILSSRDIVKGENAVKELKSENLNVDYVQLDISDSESVKSAQKYVQSTYGKIDVLINNAAIAINKDFNYDIFRETFKTNYFGTLDVIDKFLPIINDNGIIINVSSTAGALTILTNENLKNQFSDPNITEAQIHDLLNQFEQSIKDGTFREKGWPNAGYASSKMFLTAHTRALANTAAFKNKSIYSVCPGFCKTNMTKHLSAPRSAQQGSEIAINLALHKVPNAVSGQFYK